MKLYKKTDLEFKNGMLVDGEGNVIPVHPHVVALANKLETEVQKAEFLEENPAPEFKEPAEFVRKSAIDELPVKEFTCETPNLAEQIERTVAIMDEIDDVDMCDRMNTALEDYKELLKWADNESVLSCDGILFVEQFDTPVLGDPLSWTADMVQDWIALSFGCQPQATEE